jgi:ribonucleotide monophosphatase NagD (HAD superfamily)
MDSGITAVLVGYDIHLSYSAIAYATLCLAAGAELMTAGLDRTEVYEDWRFPSTGTHTHLIEAAAGRDPAQTIV